MTPAQRSHICLILAIGLLGTQLSSVFGKAKCFIENIEKDYTASEVEVVHSCVNSEPISWKIAYTVTSNKGTTWFAASGDGGCKSTSSESSIYYVDSARTVGGGTGLPPRVTAEFITPKIKTVCAVARCGGDSEECTVKTDVAFFEEGTYDENSAPTLEGEPQSDDDPIDSTTIIIIGAGGGILLLVLSAVAAMYIVKKRKHELSQHHRSEQGGSGSSSTSVDQQVGHKYQSPSVGKDGGMPDTTDDLKAQYPGINVNNQDIASHYGKVDTAGARKPSEPMKGSLSPAFEDETIEVVVHEPGRPEHFSVPSQNGSLPTPSAPPIFSPAMQGHRTTASDVPT